MGTERLSKNVASRQEGGKSSFLEWPHVVLFGMEKAGRKVENQSRTVMSYCEGTQERVAVPGKHCTSPPSSWDSSSPVHPAWDPKAL